MKIMPRKFILILATLSLTVFGGMQLAAAETARIDVVLVQAGNNGKGVDKSLRTFAPTLQRLFRFNSYSEVKRQSVRLEVPGVDEVSLGHGQSLTIRASNGGENLRAEVEWNRGSKRLLHTRIRLRNENPAVLGGPQSADGTWLLILQLK